MATEANYYGGDYRTWATVQKAPKRSDYAKTAVRAHIFPEDGLHYLAEPTKPFNFYWHSTKARFDDEIDDLQEKGYVRVIVEGENPNFTAPTRWQRRGPGGTVLWKGYELWAQPAEIGIALEEEELRRLNPRRKAEEIENSVRGVEEDLKRQGFDGIEVVNTKPAKPSGSKK